MIRDITNQLLSLLRNRVQNPRQLEYFVSILGIGAQDRQVEEPLWVPKSILFEFEVEKLAEPKALLARDLQKLVSKHGSFGKAAIAIGTSEAFVRQNTSDFKP